MSKAPEFSYTPEQVKDLCETAIKDLESGLTDLVNIPGPQRNFKNTMLAFENAVSGFGGTVQVPIFLAYVSDNEDLRKAGQEMELRISRYSVDLFTREDIFNALSEYAAKGEKLEAVEARLLERSLLDFKRNGLGLEPRKKNKVKKLKKELIGLELDFSKNLREVNDVLEVSEEELEGLPEDFKARLKKSEGGKYLVTMNYPDYIPFMDNAENGGARRRLGEMFNNRCSPVNIELMEKAIALRRKSAKLLGYPSYAEYVLDNRMAGNSENVISFLERTWARLKKKGRKELRARLKLKGGEDKVLNAWESRYYNNQLKKTKYAIDHEKIKEYFPLETVINGMFGVFGEVLGARFDPAQLPAWHKDVRAYEVKNADGSIAAYFYFDLFPRDGKYKHAACFGLRHGRVLEDGSYELPAAAIVANFPPPSGGSPALLTFDDVVTLFHEFGHVTHNIFTKAKYGKFSGTSVSRDFVEVPSKMLENWAYCPEVLRRISGHFKAPSEKLPEKIIKKLIAAKNMDSGLGNLRQLFFSLLDMRYHTARGKVDTTKLYEKLMKKISLIPMSPGTHPQASFGHLMGGYEAGYYSYLWSEVIAADLFGVFEASGVMNPETGAKYRELILAPGRSYDEAGQVEKFLGRPSTEDAFLKSIGAA
ncbi:MAG: peptidase [Elusimicrobia bacterium CG08_land_8_20_14_0_20_59_10]|nr:MAG: peptidase [Elusimicrobia bacterium CG08_land_8_20_14_0_20_59_10]